MKNDVKRELSMVRATAMKGSSGTQKEHYGQRKIAVRIITTDIMLIFFGIHIANVVNVARRKSVQVALAADVPCERRNSMGVVALYMTENEKSALKPKPMK